MSILFLGHHFRGQNFHQIPFSSKNKQDIGLKKKLGDKKGIFIEML